MKDEEIKSQINALIRDEIQDVINDYVDAKKISEEVVKQNGLGFVDKDEEDELKVSISQKEIDKILKEYKKIKKGQKSNLTEIKKLGLVDKHGRPLS